jgi:hypothetical protein
MDRPRPWAARSNRIGQAATAILAALDTPHPRLRLALGADADAANAMRAKHDRLRADIERRESVSRGTAFDQRRAADPVDRSRLRTPHRCSIVSVRAGRSGLPQVWGHTDLPAFRPLSSVGRALPW